MNYKLFMCNPLQENCYVVSDETGECVVIDCGAYYEEEQSAVLSYIRQHHLKPVHLLATHGHFDHNFGNAALYRELGLKAEVCAEDEQLLGRIAEQTKAFLLPPPCTPMNYELCTMNYETPPVGRLLKHADTVSFGTHTLEVLQTPGHTPGSALFYCEAEHVVFSGDTLFRMSIGRTDLDGGSWSDMEQSLRTVVAALPPDTTVCPGHGPQTVMSDELMYNPYLNRG